MKTLSRPCPSCPWQQHAVAADIPNFDLAFAERLANTCPNERGYGPDFFASIFACHLSKFGEEFACTGWLAVVGRCHPQVRLAVMQDEMPASALEPGADWPPLHRNFGEVIRKLRATCHG